MVPLQQGNQKQMPLTPNIQPTEGRSLPVRIGLTWRIRKASCRSAIAGARAHLHLHIRSTVLPLIGPPASVTPSRQRPAVRCSWRITNRPPNLPKPRNAQADRHAAPGRLDSTTGVRCRCCQAVRVQLADSIAESNPASIILVSTAHDAGSAKHCLTAEPLEESTLQTADGRASQRHWVRNSQGKLMPDRHFELGTLSDCG